MKLLSLLVCKLCSYEDQDCVSFQVINHIFTFNFYKLDILPQYTLPVATVTVTMAILEIELVSFCLMASGFIS